MIVLTGGAGFIGSCFLKKLNDENISDILVVDRLGTSEKWKNLIGKKFIGYDNKDEFRTKLSQGKYNGAIDAIFHIGACSDTTERNADYLIDNNFSYSKELAEFALSNGIRFIYAGSAATYGDGKAGYSDLEFDNLKPLNVYGMSKHIFDVWLIQNKLENAVTGFKFFNVFGPNEYHKGNMSSMVYKAFNQIKASGRIRLFKSYLPDYKDGEQMRDFIYVKDIIETLWRAFKATEIKGIYNLGTGKARTWNDLATAVFQASNKNVNIEYISMPDELINQYQYFTQADMSKLSGAPLMIDFTELEDAVNDYVGGYLLKNWQYF